MTADGRPRDDTIDDTSVHHPTVRVITAGASVVLLQPRKLRGTIGVVRRPVPGGWEVEIRSALGTPMHLTLPERSLHLR